MSNFMRRSSLMLPFLHLTPNPRLAHYHFRTQITMILTLHPLQPNHQILLLTPPYLHPLQFTSSHIHLCPRQTQNHHYYLPYMIHLLHPVLPTPLSQFPLGVPPDPLVHRPSFTTMYAPPFPPTNQLPCSPVQAKVRGIPWLIFYLITDIHLLFTLLLHSSAWPLNPPLIPRLPLILIGKQP